MRAPRAPAAGSQQEIALEEAQRIAVRTSAPRLALRIDAPHCRRVGALHWCRPSSRVARQRLDDRRSARAKRIGHHGRPYKKGRAVYHLGSYKKALQLTISCWRRDSKCTPRCTPIAEWPRGISLTSRLSNRNGPLILLIGAPRFELGTPCTPCKCATRLRHAPILGRI
jgi:hypothetical protein